MLRKLFSDEAIILDKRDHGEADRIIVIYSRTHGKEVLVAKGVRRPSSRKRGHLEVFNHIRFSAVQGDTRPLINEAEVLDAYGGIRRDLKKMSVAYFLTEVVEKLTREKEASEQLFFLLKDTLSHLEHADRLKTIRHEFIQQILVLIGFWPLGKPMNDPDRVLTEVAEKNLSSFRVGKKLTS